MATAKVLSMLDCGVCKGTFKVPVSLNCQHTFCKNCLRPLAKDKDISCPICRASQPLPKGGINALQEHPVLRQLVELQTKKTKCPNCNDVCVPDTCDHCNRLLCSSCLENHNPVLFKNIDNTVKLLEKDITNLTTSSDELQKAKELIETTEEQAKVDITEKIEKYIEMLKAKEEELKEKIPNMIDEENGKLTEEHDKIQTGLEERNDFLEKANNLLNSWDNSDVQDMEQLSEECSKYQENYKGYSPANLKVVFKDVMDTEIRNAIEKFGSVKLEGPTPPSTPIRPTSSGPTTPSNKKNVKKPVARKDSLKEPTKAIDDMQSQASSMANMY